MKKNIIIIPMRSGSKGIKDKNIKNFCTLPLFSWSIAKVGILLDKKKIDQCIVSSDSEEYLDLVFSFFSPLCENGKLILSKRPVDLATDTSITEDVCEYEIDRLRITTGILTILEVTSPNLPISSIEEMLDLMELDKLTSSFLITSDVAQRWSFSSEKNWYPLYEKRRMRQNDKPIYKEVGAWSVRVEDFLRYKNRILEPCLPVIVGNQYGISINTQDEFEFAMLLFNKYKEEIFRDGF